MWYVLLSLPYIPELLSYSGALSLLFVDKSFFTMHTIPMLRFTLWAYKQKNPKKQMMDKKKRFDVHQGTEIDNKK